MPLPPAQPLKKVTLHAIIGLKPGSPKNVAWLFALRAVLVVFVFSAMHVFAWLASSPGASVHGVWSVYVGHRSNRDKLIACCKSDHYFQHITNKYGHH